MTRRRGHIRTNQHGTTFQVREHALNSATSSRIFDLRWKRDQAYVNGAVTYQTICPQCKTTVYFYRNEHGSRVFFDALGKPWPKHACMHGVKKMKSMSVTDAEPVTKSNYSKSPSGAGDKGEMFVDIDGLNTAVHQYTRDLRKAALGAKKSKKLSKKKKK
ncbi:hypothetical protein QEZ52_18420 [Aliisedimentitalea scapharcae]|uniref:Uncharacterized protein n=1 Tax=Aliisedimentitalea scapharcae TaxID=1524259 RepID=A0ABZ2XR17_9RHOB